MFICTQNPIRKLYHNVAIKFGIIIYDFDQHCTELGSKSSTVKMRYLHTTKYQYFTVVYLSKTFILSIFALIS